MKPEIIAGIVSLLTALLTLLAKGWLDRHKTAAEVETTSLENAMKLIKAYQEDRDDLRKQVTALQTESDTQRGEIWKLQQENAQLRSEGAAREQEIADLRSEVEMLKGKGT